MDSPEKRINDMEYKVRLHHRLFLWSGAALLGVLLLIWVAGTLPATIQVQALEIVGPAGNVVVRVLGTDQGGGIELMTNVSTRARVHLGIENDGGYLSIFKGGQDQVVVRISAGGAAGQVMVNGRELARQVN